MVRSAATREKIRAARTGTSKLSHLQRHDLERLLQAYTQTQVLAHLGVGYVALKHRLIQVGLTNDLRGEANRRRQKPIPPASDLLQWYVHDGLTMVDIGKRCGVSNVTVKKWLCRAGIPLLSHSAVHQLRVQPKIQASNQQKFGYTHFFSTQRAKEKIANTFIQKYGVPYHPIGSTSLAETEVLTYLNSVAPGFTKFRGLGIELDGYHPELKFAVEYCGLYWHSEDRKGRLAHYKKYRICQQHGLRLWTIFEDEWCERNDQVRGFLAAALGQYNTRIGARTCTVERVAPRNHDAIQAYGAWHIQGPPNLALAVQHYLLRDRDGEIVAVMGFGRHHRTVTRDLVLTRWVVKPGYCVIGGAQKVFAAATADFSCPIISWSDNRWTDGALYQRLGFVCQKDLPPDYAYVAGRRRVPKQQCTKAKLASQPGQTEAEAALAVGLKRIWDCGKKVWRWTPPSLRTTNPHLAKLSDREFRAAVARAVEASSAVEYPSTK